VRVLHVLAERGFSGGEHQLSAVLEHLRNAGHESRVVLTPGAAFESRVHELGLELHPIPMRNDLDLVAIMRLGRLFRRLAPDLVHLACSRSHKLGAFAAALSRFRVPMVVTRRMDYPIPKTRFRRWLYSSAVAGVVVVSRAVSDEILALGVPSDRIHVIHDGVDTRAIAAAIAQRDRRQVRSELGFHEDEVVGLTLASLHHRKGLDVLVDALIEVSRSSSRPIRWVMGGEGPEVLELTERVKRLPPSLRIDLPGQIDAVAHLAVADLFCLPSRKEGLGVALLEAMAAGLPVIASAVGGMTEAFVDGESGLHVPPGDSAALAAAISRLIEEPGLATRLASAAQARVKQLFDLQRMCQRTEECYSGIIERHRMND